MICTIVVYILIYQVLLQLSSGASTAKLKEEDLETFDTDSLSFLETLNETQPELNSGEIEDWEEWDDYEEHTGNNCNLTSFEINNRASYLCQDGTTWSVNIAQTGNDKCIYSRNVKNPSGQNEIKKTLVNCADAQEWLEDLMQYEVLSGIPDMFLFSSGTNENENTKNIPIIYEPFLNP